MEKLAKARRFLRRLVLVLVLLIAQQSAVDHRVWHFAESVAHPAELTAIAEIPIGNVPAREALCRLHAPLGAVLGIIGGDAPPVTLAATEEVHVTVRGEPAGTHHAVRPVSRGPPLAL